MDTEKLIEQLKEIKNSHAELDSVKKIIFFTETLENDPNLKPYQISIKTACERLNIEFTMIEMGQTVNN